VLDVQASDFNINAPVFVMMKAKKKTSPTDYLIERKAKIEMSYKERLELMLDRFIDTVKMIRIDGLCIVEDDEFQSSRDLLKNYVSFYRYQKKTNRASKEELNLLGFLTHMLNNQNFCNH